MTIEAKLLVACVGMLVFLTVRAVLAEYTAWKNVRILRAYVELVAQGKAKPPEDEA
jgi:hypothetical protein